MDLPTKNQFIDLLNVKDGSISGHCITIKNTVGDTNMPVNSTDEVCNLRNTGFEYTSTGKYIDNSSDVNSLSNSDFNNETTDNQGNTKLRAATAYIQ